MTTQKNPKTIFNFYNREIGRQRGGQIVRGAPGNPGLKNFTYSLSFFKTYISPPQNFKRHPYKKILGLNKKKKKPVEPPFFSALPPKKIPYFFFKTPIIYAYSSI